ncbi:hypothetical protein BO94DRAFT_520752 [Aspergillus sclerotioniger CBS 115572]|uniref:PEBP-like protein n=1 Tax=Aspergillus sclerotioniger CBS 115572 TaxID=1450535 RepID=A0A317W2E3_9EURO|nr:hypothetical protein BO94DRAFT_520752 [Aspergillus sclerotioniger CBS 115572]PWY80806.1 hypothetical protein BO94DRAFT_520752 [Aspergillus sclerotioniger CBS 115572]
MFKSLAALALAAGIAGAQSPPRYIPSSSTYLGLEFNTTVVAPGRFIDAALVSNEPVTFPAKTSSDPLTYQVFMLDISIPSVAVTEDTGYPLVPGIAANDTTRLHWWQGNLTVQDGIFVNSSQALAPWNIPEPEGTADHYYAFYLFAQPEDWSPSAAVLDGLYADPYTDARYNFSLVAIAEQVGEPVAANYLLSLESSS